MIIDKITRDARYVIDINNWNLFFMANTDKMADNCDIFVF